MDQNPQGFTEETRKRIYDELADALIAALEKGEIPEEEEQKSSAFILQELDSVDTNEKLLAFLKALSESWPIYLSVYTKMQNEEIEKKEAIEIDKIKDKINNIAN